MSEARVTLEKDALSLEFGEAVLRARNCLSGSAADVPLQGFALVLGGEELAGAQFEWEQPDPRTGQALLRGRHPATGIEARVLCSPRADQP
ncbi:MAG: hypothetical protein AB7Y46_02370 [Armatimonadota bacterium]